MHDRRIEGKPHVFGNAGALFMNAMTWYDHETRSIWSQPLGRAFMGPRAGTELELLASELTSWNEWKREHPESRAMINFVDRLGASRIQFDENFVIGLVLADQAKAYPYRAAAAARVINDSLGKVPVVVWAAEQTFHAYVRRADERVLTFRAEADKVIDNETGSRWNVARGLAIEGPLTGRALQPVPSLTAYDWAWRDFYPQSEFYTP